MREICKACWNVNPVGFSVPDPIWQRVTVPLGFQDHVLCIMCFARFADEIALDWSDAIQLYPVSWAASQRSDL